jgi:hypothetical protein
MNHPRVFVVQNQHRLNAEKQGYEPKYDLTPAREFGTLVYLLGPSANPLRPAPLITELRHSLRDFGPNDYLLLIGNPVLIVLAGSIASSYAGGSINVLQWSGKEQRYLAISIHGLDTDQAL